MHVERGAAPRGLATSTAPSTPFVSLADASTAIVCSKNRIRTLPLLGDMRVASNFLDRDDQHRVADASTPPRASD
jgi:hypothetical protein